MGGAQLALLETIEGLDRSAIEPVVVVPAEGSLSERAKASGAVVEVVDAPWWLRPKSAIGPLRRHYLEDLPTFIGPLVDLIAEHKVDLVYSGSAVILHGAIAAALTGRPHLWHVHENLRAPGLPLVLPPGGAATVSMVLRTLASLIVVPTAAIAPSAAAHVRAIPCGVRPPMEVEDSALDFIEPARIRVGLIGEVTPAKGSQIVPEIVRNVCRACHDVEFYWIGAVDAGTRAGLESASVIDGRQRLHLLGFQNDIWPFLRSVDILLHASWNETLPRVLMEAATAGRPSVATQSGGIEEIVVHGESGWLAKPGDVAALSRAIVALAGDDRQRAVMGENARRLSSAFSLTTYQTRMQRAILDTVSTGPVLQTDAFKALLRAGVAAPGIASQAWRRVKGLNR